MFLETTKELTMRTFILTVATAAALLVGGMV
jgi:hypothetical protein